MAEREFGEAGFYLPGFDVVLLPFQVRLNCEGETAEEADVSEARVYERRCDADEHLLGTHELVRVGDGTLRLELSEYDLTQSPLLIKFVFEKTFTCGPKEGTTESSEVPVCLSLAEPIVGAIEVPWHTKAGVEMTLRVACDGWRVLARDEPDDEPTELAVDPSCLPEDIVQDVRWRVDGEELEARGPEVRYRVPDDVDHRQVLRVVAWVGDEAPPEGDDGDADDDADASPRQDDDDPDGDEGSGDGDGSGGEGARGEALATDFFCVEVNAVAVQDAVVEGIDGVYDTGGTLVEAGARQLAGKDPDDDDEELLQVEGGVCPDPHAPTCHPDHADGHVPGTDDKVAGHVTQLEEDSPYRARVAVLAGLWGLDVSEVENLGDRALHITSYSSGRSSAHAIKDIQLADSAPWAELSVVGLGSGNHRDPSDDSHTFRHEGTQHIHLEADGARTVAAYLNEELWGCLPFVVDPRTQYALFKRMFWQASYHRQWGRVESIAWLEDLLGLYLAEFDEPLGVGDLSEVLGGDMTDHGWHEQGVDVDLYVLMDVDTTNYPRQSFPRAHYCVDADDDDEGAVGGYVLEAMGTPANANGEYDSGSRSSDADQALAWKRYTLILAYCLITHPVVERIIWYSGDAIVDAAKQKVADWLASWGSDLASHLPNGAREGWLDGDDAAIDTWLTSHNGLWSKGETYAGGHKDHVHVRLDHAAFTDRPWEPEPETPEGDGATTGP